MEVDPFEARLEFRALLGKLNASQHSIQKVGSFALKNRNLYEDLYNCIIEELDQTPSINARMNIFYVLDSICHQSSKAHFSGYIDLIQRNLPKIIESVAPSGTGDVNVGGTKKTLESWRMKKIFHEPTLDKVLVPLRSREPGTNAPLTTPAGFSKDDILRRMDDDRERHKRIREEIWIRPSDEDPSTEFMQQWDEVSDMDEHDYEDMESENQKYLPGYPWSMEFDPMGTAPSTLPPGPAPAPEMVSSSVSHSSSSAHAMTPPPPPPPPALPTGPASESKKATDYYRSSSSNSNHYTSSSSSSTAHAHPHSHSHAHSHAHSQSYSTSNNSTTPYPISGIDSSSSARGNPQHHQHHPHHSHHAHHHSYHESSSSHRSDEGRSASSSGYTNGSAH